MKSYAYYIAVLSVKLMQHARFSPLPRTLSRTLPLYLVIVLLIGFHFPSAADERDEEAAKAAALNLEAEEQPPPRPARMPDLTKGDPLPAAKKGRVAWNMGPTGIVGIKNGGNAGDQVQISVAL